jgi:hypothetical protein
MHVLALVQQGAESENEDHATLASGQAFLSKGGLHRFVGPAELLSTCEAPALQVGLQSLCTPSLMYAEFDVRIV